MKLVSRLLALLTLVMLLVLPIAAQSVTYVSPRFNQLNVRSGPGLEHDVITQIYGISQYPVLDRSFTGNWLLIDIGYAHGWVHQAYVNESNYGYNVVTNANPGQGGGYVVPAGYVAPTYIVTVPTVNVTGVSNLGQGGGFAMPTTTTITSVQVQSAEYISNTVGSWVGLNIRRGPDHTYGVVAIMPQGDRAIPLGRNSRGTWYFVEYNGVQGWVTHELVSVPPNIDVVALPVVSNE